LVNALLDQSTLLSAQDMFLQGRNIPSILNVSTASIEPSMLRAFIFNFIDPFRPYAPGAVSSSMPQHSLPGSHGQQISSKEYLDRLGIDIKMLGKVIALWGTRFTPTTQLHKIELLLLKSLHELMQGFHETLASWREDGADISRLNGVIAGHMLKEKTKEQLADVLLNHRTSIQSLFVYLWALSNEKSREFDTLATITGMSHMPQLLSRLLERLGDKFWSFSPVVVLTDKDAQIEGALLEFGDRLIIKRLK
jgi:hypothetical protein